MVSYNLLTFFCLQTIDSDELEKMLDLLSQKGSSTMYTKKEVKDIFRKIDADNTNSIDFMEVLGVMWYSFRFSNVFPVQGKAVTHAAGTPDFWLAADLKNWFSMWTFINCSKGFKKGGGGWSIETQNFGFISWLDKVVRLAGT